MKKTLLALLMLVTISIAAEARPKIQGIAQKGGKVVQTSPTVSYKLMETFPSCTITVYLAGTTTLASIYSDNAGTVKANPFTAGTDASFDFYVDDGSYDIKLSGTGVTTPFNLVSNFAVIDLLAAAEKLGSRIYVLDYASLSSLVSTLGSLNKYNVVISENITISSNLTVTDNFTLERTNGAIITVNNAVALYINGPLDADCYTLFNLVGTGQVYFGMSSIKKACPQWMGAKGDARYLNGGTTTTAGSATITVSGLHDSTAIGKSIVLFHAGTPTSYTGSMTNASPTLTLSSGSTKVFPTDENRIVTVSGSGIAAGTTITNYLTPTTATLSNSASATVTDVAVTMSATYVGTIVGVAGGNSFVVSPVVPTSVTNGIGYYGTDLATPMNKLGLALSRNFTDFNLSLIGRAFVAPIHIPAGQYISTSEITLGFAGFRNNGIEIEGDGEELTKIYYAGSKVTSALKPINAYNSRIEGLSIDDLNRGSIAGLWWSSAQGMSGGTVLTHRVQLSNFNYQLAIGAGTYTQLTDTASAQLSSGQMNNGTHDKIKSVGGNYPIAMFGANTENQHFRSLDFGGDIIALLKGYNSRGVVIDGFEGSINSNSFACPYLLDIQGGSVGGAKNALLNGRVENGYGLLIGRNLDNGVTVTGFGTNQTIQMEFANIAFTSTPFQDTTVSGAYYVRLIGGGHNLSFRNVAFTGIEGKFRFEELTNARYTSVALENCLIRNSTADADIKSLMSVTTTDTGTAGSVEAVFLGNQQMHGTLHNEYPIGRIADRRVRITPDDVVANKALSVYAFPLVGRKTFDFPSVANGAFTTTTVTVTGAKVGDVAHDATLSITIPDGVRIQSKVTADNTVTVVLYNNSGGAVDLASATLTQLVTRQEYVKRFNYEKNFIFDGFDITGINSLF